MGNGNSREAKGSRRSRLIQKLQKFRTHRRHLRSRCSRNSAGVVNQKAVSAENFSGIALLTLIGADIKFKDKWLACVSFGEQTFRTEISDTTEKPSWNSEKKLLLEKNGPSLVRISVFETNKLSRNKIVGYCELDIFDFVVQEPESASKSFDLLDPTSSKVTISLSCAIEDPVESEKRFAKRILSIVDYNEDGQLSFSEFSGLIKAFGNLVAAKKKEELFRAADLNGDGVVTIDELAALLALQQEKEPIINNCPVCGEAQLSDKLNAMIHMTLCFDEGTGNQVMTGGFLTDRQASYGTRSGSMRIYWLTVVGP
ncbi:PREDICTED: phosphatidylserine decarboxylase proenzyme 2-like [Camelina sativa]|uniref:Phosphatidylserine decarboxylase proenzyme 2-like n=1 Tax=Camelina sativa TaxID=90675 RepID=A0ABM0UMP0_CAMSA|nr:PREDICTED: phosphatidylserine decarboxylase proenzyme 2-like [Camelina sativa]